MQRVVGESPDRIEDQLWPVKVVGDRGVCRRIGEQRRDAEPEQARPPSGTGDERRADQFRPGGRGFGEPVDQIGRRLRVNNQFAAADIYLQRERFDDL